MSQHKNIFLTGAPSSGKTTVIKKLLPKLPVPANGFYTEEERQHAKRVGFLMRTLDGKRGYLGHERIVSHFHIRRYGVSVENIENIAVPSMMPVEGQIIVMDEIGKMECFSQAFKLAAVKTLDSPNIVVGTITLGGTDFIHQIKQRTDIDLIEVTEENRNTLTDIILEKLTKITGR